MDAKPDDVIARLLAENEKINTLTVALNNARQAVIDGNDQLRVAKEKLAIGEFGEALSWAETAVGYYKKLVLSLQTIHDAENTSPDVEQLKKDAFDLLQQSQPVQSEAEEVKFVANDLSGLKTNIESEIADENWILVGYYAVDALSAYRQIDWFKHYDEIAKQKIIQQQPEKQTWARFLLRRHQ